MKKWIVGLGVITALGLIGQPVFAQETKGDLTWNGGVSVRAFLTQNTTDADADFNDDTAFVDERAWLRATCALVEDVSVVIEAAFYGTLGDVVGGSGGEDADAFAPSDLYLNKGYIVMNNLLTEGLALSVGRQPLCFQLKPPADGKYGGFREGAYYLDSAANDDAIQSVDGIVVSWGKDEELKLDVYILTMAEATPNVFSGGGGVTPSDNVGAQGVNVAWQSETLAINGHIGAVQGLDMVFGPGSPFEGNGSLMSIDVGAVYTLSPTFEIYGELLFQTGTYHDAAHNDLDISGNGIYVGANFAFDEEGGAFVGGEIEMTTGRGDDADATAEVMQFAESRATTVIVQGETFFDVSSNFMKIQVWGGAEFQIGEANSGIKGTFATYSVQDDAAPGGDIFNPLFNIADESDLGLEIDVMWWVDVTEDVTLKVTLANYAPGAAVADPADAINAIIVETGAAF